jgi:hypothetical protein
MYVNSHGGRISMEALFNADTLSLVTAPQFLIEN